MAADKKDEFRKYLERTKLINVLTRSLTDLYELDDRPDDPIAYLHKRLGEHVTDSQAPATTTQPPSTNTESKPTPKPVQETPQTDAPAETPMAE